MVYSQYKRLNTVCFVFIGDHVIKKRTGSTPEFE